MTPEASQVEIYLLILKFLESRQGFAKTAVEFQRDLDEQKLLGKIYNWDGTSHDATVTELSKKFKRVRGDHLQLILQQALVDDRNTANNRNLLRPLWGIFDPSDISQCKAFSNISSQLVAVQWDLCRIRNQRNSLLLRQHTLRLTREDPTISDRAYSTAIDTLTNIGFQDELKDIGQSKALVHIERELESLSILESSHAETVQGHIKQLDKQNCLAAGFTRSRIDSGLCWLMGRSLGVTNSGMGFTSGFAHISAASATSLGRNIRHHFKWQATITGHLHPCYCSIFDQTGRFAITGADDGIVKVWDIEKGILVYTCRGHPGCISLIEVSPDNSLIASACTEGSVRLWRMKDGKCLKVLKHGASVSWIKFDVMTSSLASVGEDGMCIVWDLSQLLFDDYSEADLMMDTSEDTLPMLHMVRQLVPMAHNGLFAWSRRTNQSVPDAIATRPGAPPAHRSTNHAKGCLLLPHAQSFVGSEKVNIKCLDISPAGDILVTGCEDGIARIWRFGDNPGKVNAGNAADPRNSTSHSSHVNSSSAAVFANEGGARRMIAGEIISDVNQLELNITNHLIKKLEGHINAITDIKFNNTGDRMVTGSVEDGTVRIWTFNHDYSKCEHIVLGMKEDGSGSDLPIRGLVNRRSTRKKSKTEVFNVVWTMDGTRIVTLNSASKSPGGGGDFDASDILTRMKVWDARTGDLIHMIPAVSLQSCKLLAAHPLDPAVVVTAGVDGFVKVWDIVGEKEIFSHQIFEDTINYKPSHIVDANFNSDGSNIVVSDEKGRLTLFGLDDSSRFSNENDQQFWSSDYAEVFWDEDGNAFDTNTQLPVFDSPRGLVCRSDGTPHSNQPQKVYGPDPLSLDDIASDMAERKRWKAKLPSIMDKIFTLFVRNRLAKREHREYVSSQIDISRNQAVVNPPGNSNSNSKAASPFHQLSSHRTHSSTVSGRGSVVDNYDRYDINGSDEEDNDSDYGAGSGGRRLGSGRRMNSGMNQRRGNRRPDRQPANTHRDRSNTRYVLRGDHIPIEVDTSSDSARSSDSEQSNNDAVGDFWTASDGEPVDGRSSNSSQFDSASHNAGKKSKSDRHAAKDKDKKKPSKRNKVSGASDRKNGGTGIWGYVNGKRTVPSDTPIDRDWLGKSDVSDIQYCPQIGDRVVYFPQGHAEMLQQFPENSRPPWHSFAQKWPVVECVVKEIAFEFPNQTEYRYCNSVIAVLTLVLVATPSKRQILSNFEYIIEFAKPRATRQSTQLVEQVFQVRLRSSNIPDCILPYHLFARCVTFPWTTGTRVTAKYREEDEQGQVQEQLYHGKILSISDCSQEWSHSPWEALEVAWEGLGSAEAQTQQIGRIGLWEAVPVLDPSGKYGRAISRNPAPEIPHDLRMDILNAFNVITSENEEAYSPFEFEVDSTVFPNYYSVVQAPVYLELLRQRLENNYYRQIEALSFDIDQIYNNCVHFNLEGTAIVATAHELVMKLHEAVQRCKRLHEEGGRMMDDAEAMDVPVSQQEASLTMGIQSDNKSGLKLRLGKRLRALHDSNSEESASGDDEEEEEEDDNDDNDDDDDDNDEKEKVGSNGNCSDDETSHGKSRRSIAKKKQKRHRDSSRFNLPVVKRATSASSSNGNGNSNRYSNSSSFPLMISISNARRSGRHSSSGEGDHDGDIAESSMDNSRRRKRVPSSRFLDAQESSSVRPRRSTSETAGTSRSSRRGDLPTTGRNEETKSQLRSRHQSEAHSSATSGSPNSRSLRQRKSLVKYQDIENSDVDNEEDEEEEVEVVVVASSRQARNSRRKDESQESNALATQSHVRAPIRLDMTVRKNINTLLSAVEEADADAFFVDPVDDEVAPGYSDVVDCPMAIATIRKKVQDRQYESLDEVVADLNLMLDNCEAYNEPKSGIVQLAKRIRKLVARLRDELFT